ncbi:Ger(x)C family spore germination protein [uncultured Paenibacillus sp.]|uniref:Ger(x)C family spore germination protein n=1 Tax=uncultured Paenibacillus sp. TaxID=227322 RepID=UPI0015A77513|nr:Ger(x)C family spore germination protein [uncultured Paenibacillus sp.]
MPKRKGKRWVFGLLSVVLAFHLTGCWDQVEIENRALVLGLAIDEAPPESVKLETAATHQKNDPLPRKMLRLTAQIAVPGRVPLGPSGGGMGSGGEKENPVWVVQVYGHSLDEALNNLQQEIADPRYLVHLRVIVISKGVAKGGLDELNDYLRRNPEVRRRTWLLVSETEAAMLMKVAPPLERIPTLYVQAMVEKAVGMGKLPPNYLGTFWIEESNWGQDGFLPYVTIQGKENILIKGLAYFSGGRLARTSSTVEIGAYMAVKGYNPGGYSVLFAVPGLGYVMTRITERHTKTHVRIVDGKPRVDLQIHIEGNLDEHFDSTRSIDSAAEIDQVEEAFERNSTEMIYDFIHQTQRDHSDIFGFGEYVRAQHPGFWRRNIHQKSDWGQMYADIPVSVNMELSIRRTGLKAK